jgi:peptidoglycan/LPS O-acetylase OafA/YrhL
MTFRIFPIYYLVLGIYCLLIFLAPAEALSAKRGEMSRALPLYILYLGEFVPPNAVADFGHAWSLKIE